MTLFQVFLIGIAMALFLSFVLDCWAVSVMRSRGAAFLQRALQYIAGNDYVVVVSEQP